MRDRLKLIDIYLGRNTLQGFALVLSVLIVLFSFLELLIQLNDVGKGAYRLQDAFLFVGMTIPRRMVDLMPVAALLGSIVSLGLLADHQELTAMQAAGISVQRIAFSVLGTSVIIMAGTLLMAEFVAPPLDQAARIQRSRAIYGKPVIMSKEGFWMRHGRSFVNVGRALPGDRAADIEVYEMDEDGRLSQFIAAREATIRGNQDWVLSGVQARRFAGETVSVSPVGDYVLSGLPDPRPGLDPGAAGRQPVPVGSLGVHREPPATGPEPPGLLPGLLAEGVPAGHDRDHGAPVAELRLRVHPHP